MREGILTLAMGAVLVAAAGTASGAVATAPGTVTRAMAVLLPTDGHSVSGVVTFTRLDLGVRVVADVSGLTPGPHGIHIHTFGNCSSPASAGGHFSPFRVVQGTAPHGAPNTLASHIGDLGNVVADASGRAHSDFVANRILLQGEDSIIGRSVMVDERADDLRTQPSGNSGPPVACGVIGIVGQ